MVTTKRQIRKDSDRFGGYYGAESNGSTLISDYETDITASERRPSGMIMTDIDTDITMKAPIAQPKVLYTTLDSARTEVPQAPIEQPIALPKREKKELRREKEDLLPTVKTRAYATENSIQEQEEQVEADTVVRKRNHRALDTKTKVLLFVYVAVALALAIAVIMTGVSISSASAEADIYSARISRNQEIINVQQNEFNDLLSAENIRDKAQDLGMIQAGSPEYSVDPIESVGYPNATERTDWFDKFCDWMSKVFN